MPGCLAATPVEAPIDIEEGLPTEVPLVYYYGHQNPSDNPDLYKFLVERLADVLSRRVCLSDFLEHQPFRDCKNSLAGRLAFCMWSWTFACLAHAYLLQKLVFSCRQMWMSKQQAW